MRFTGSLFFFFLSCVLFAQQPTILRPVQDGTVRPNQGQTRTGDVNTEGEKPPITDYKIISIKNDTTVVDTSLTVQKMYAFNYLRRDDVNLLPFQNVGQTYNTLVYDFEKTRLTPRFAAQARHFNYMETQDINYYYVPTPFTDLYFKTAFEQGQQLDAFFTSNTSKQFNFSIAYKGVRSLGKYVNSLTSTGNFRFSTNYHTKNKRYFLRTHITFQDLSNEENAGVQPLFLDFFRSGSNEFRDRARLEVNQEDAENILKGKRFYLDHNYVLFQNKDSIAEHSLSIGNSLQYEEKFYRYTQASPKPELFGEAFTQGAFQDRVDLEEFKAAAWVNYSNQNLGSLRVGLGYTDFNYGYNRLLVLNDQTINNRIIEDISHAEASYNTRWEKFNIHASAGHNLSGSIDGSYVNAQLNFKWKNNIVEAGVSSVSEPANLNFQLFQSNYINYNWQNDFDNTKRNSIKAALTTSKWGRLEAEFTSLDDYLYFTKDQDSVTLPKQFDGSINHLKLAYTSTFKYKHFNFENYLVYQTVDQSADVFNVPEVLLRTTWSYENYAFKKAMFFQTGVNLKYFTSYKMNAYDPILAEFYVQDSETFGDFPLIDVFFNAKVRQARIFLILEHINSSLTGFNFFSAPANPYRDFNIRFGLVWNFFL